MTRVPAPHEVRTLLELLLDRRVEVAYSAPWLPAEDDTATFAVYVDDTLLVQALAVADLPFSAYVSAAIGLLPAHWPDRAIAAQVLPPELEENLHEVLDICAALENGDDQPHTTLYRMHEPGGQLPDYVKLLAAVLGRRCDLTVRISGYGCGRLSFVGASTLVPAGDVTGASQPESAAGPR